MKKRTVIFDMVTIILLCGLLSGCGQIRNAHPITDVHNLDGQRPKRCLRSFQYQQNDPVL